MIRVPIYLPITGNIIRQPIYLPVTKKITRKPIYIKKELTVRQTIYLPVTKKITRKPIYLSKFKFNRMSINFFTYSEILEVVQYYEMKVRQAINTSGYVYISRKHLQGCSGKKYHLLITFLTFLRLKNVDFRVYIDSQFERLPNWKHIQVYPYIEQMYSPAAWKCYNNYLARFPNTPKVTQTFFTEEQEVIDSVIKDCELILEYSKYPSLSHYTPQQRELKFIAEHSIILSKYFWSTINWAKDWLKNFEDKSYKELLSQVLEIQASKARLERIVKIVLKIKRKMGVPFIDSDWL